MLIYVSCNSEIKKSSIIDKIPDNPLVVLSIDNVKEIDYKKLNFISNSINLKFDEIDLLNPESELIFSFHKSGKDNIENIIIQKSDNFLINKDLVKDTINYNGQKIYNYKDDYFISIIESYVFFSKDKLLVENIIRGATFLKNNNFSSFKKLHYSKSKNISLNVSENFKSLNFSTKEEDISKYSNWIQYEFELENDDINILGISSKDINNREINLLTELNKTKSNILKIVPNNFKEFKRMSFNDFIITNNYNSFFNNSNVNEKKINPVFENVNELGEIKINDEPILIVNFEKIELEELFENLIEVSKYRDESIYKANSIKLSNFDVFDFKLSKEYNFFTLIENSLALSNDISSIQNLILNYKNQSLLIKNDNFLPFLNTIPKKTTFYEILNLSDLKTESEYPFWFSNYEVKDGTNYKSIFSTPSFELKTDKKLNLRFSKKINSEVILDPKFIYNYKTGENNIIFQDQDLNLVIFDLDGNKIFEKKLGSKIISDITQVDIYKNNRLQFAFITSDDFLVLDINGRIVKEIPFENSNSKKFLSIFDYDKNRNYRFVIQNGKTITMYDSKFRKVNGFKKTKVKSEPKHKMKHLRILNNDYLIIVDKFGLPLILDRRGNIRIKLPKNFKSGLNHFFKNGDGIVSINNLNQLVRIELNGKISSKQLVDEKNLLTADNKNLFIQSNGLLSINDNEFKIPYGDFNDLSIFKSNNKTYYHTRIIDNNKSFLYNSIGKISGFPIFSKSKIDMIFENNEEFITLKGDNDEILLYSLN